MKNIIILSVSALALSACANPYEHADPKKLAACEYEAAKVGGYDWIDAAINRSKVLRFCMERGN